MPAVPGRLAITNNFHPRGDTMKFSLTPLVILAVLLAGCSHTATYNSAYLSAPPPEASERMEGKVLVYTERTEDNYTFTGNPTSFTGGATTLNVPLGQITREVAVYAFGRHFKDGADASNKLENLAGYRAIIHPRLLSFTYEYNQLKNLGFAITPGVTLEIETQLLDQGGKSVYAKKHASGLVQGYTYVVSGTPGERINQLVHETLYKLMDEAAQDIKRTLKENGS
jgi:hypothetical protein